MTGRSHFRDFRTKVRLVMIGPKMMPSTTMPSTMMLSTTIAVTFEGYTLELEPVPCDFCGSTEFWPFWTKMRHGLNLPTVVCKTCGLCMTNPRPTLAATDLFYDKLYHRFHKAEYPITDNSEYVTRSARLAAPRLKTLKQFLPPEAPLSVFEIGAGVGQFQLAVSGETPWHVSGIEPGGESFVYCKERGLDVARKYVEEVSGERLHDAIVSFHVLEHVPSPRKFLAIARGLLKPDGILYLEVPNLSRPGGPSLGEFFQFPHLYSFTATTLRNYLVAGGFAPVFVAERNYSLTMIAKLAEQPPGGVERRDFEHYDIENFMQRMRMLERVHRLASWLPNVSVLGKIRSTLQAI